VFGVAIDENNLGVTLARFFVTTPKAILFAQAFHNVIIIDAT
jgi:hypothetical protein